MCKAKLTFRSIGVCYFFENSDFRDTVLPLFCRIFFCQVPGVVYCFGASGVDEIPRQFGHFQPCACFYVVGVGDCVAVCFVDVHPKVLVPVIF